MHSKHFLFSQNLAVFNYGLEEIFKLLHVQLALFLRFQVLFSHPGAIIVSMNTLDYVIKAYSTCNKTYNESCKNAAARFRKTKRQSSEVVKFIYPGLSFTTEKPFTQYGSAVFQFFL